MCLWLGVVLMFAGIISGGCFLRALIIRLLCTFSLSDSDQWGTHIRDNSHRAKYHFFFSWLDKLLISKANSKKGWSGECEPGLNLNFRFLPLAQTCPEIHVLSRWRMNS